LKNFHLRQRVLAANYNYLNQPIYFPPYIEEIPSSLKHKSYRIFIAARLKTLWQQTAVVHE
jgi:hypothetical protein